MPKKPIIGLAGGIGSGKSTVARLLAELGCVVADSDVAARASLDDPEIRRRILEEFGEEILRQKPEEIPTGRGGGGREAEVDRAALASIVFSDPARRRALEAIIHPWVEQRRLEQFAAAPADVPAFVIDAPLLFEADLDRLCDAVIFVDAPRETRLSRVRSARGWSEQELELREASQMPLDEKRSRADYVLTNSGSVEELSRQVRRMLATIVTPGPGRS